MLWLNSMTCCLIYQRKALFDHWPMSMIVYTGHLPRYMAIAEPNLMEWVPISSLEIPWHALPMAHTASQRALITCRDVTCSTEPLDM
jgi:hypothetical protein